MMCLKQQWQWCFNLLLTRHGESPTDLFKTGRGKGQGTESLCLLENHRFRMQILGKTIDFSALAIPGSFGWLRGRFGGPEASCWPITGQDLGEIVITMWVTSVDREMNSYITVPRFRRPNLRCREGFFGDKDPCK